MPVYRCVGSNGASPASALACSAQRWVELHCVSGVSHDLPRVPRRSRVAPEAKGVTPRASQPLSLITVRSATNDIVCVVVSRLCVDADLAQLRRFTYLALYAGHEEVFDGGSTAPVGGWDILFSAAPREERRSRRSTCGLLVSSAAWSSHPSHPLGVPPTHSHADARHSCAARGDRSPAHLSNSQTS